MSDTETLKNQGYVEYSELCALVAKNHRVNVNTLRMWLAGPLSKVRSMLVKDGTIVLPDDRSWNCLYDPSLALVLTAYIKWHRFGGRHSVAEVVSFFEDFEAGKTHAINHLPPRFRSIPAFGSAPDNVVLLRRTGTS